MLDGDVTALRTADEVRSSLVGDAALQELRRALAAILDDGHAVRRLTLRRSKFKPGRKLSAYFGVSVRPGDVAPHEVAVIKSSAAEAVRTAGIQAAAIEDEAAYRGLMGPFRSLEACLPGHARILVSPLDPAFPSLVQFSDPEFVGNLLGAGGRVSVTALRYRPGQRHVLRYVHPGRTAPVTLFAKLCSNGDELFARERQAALADSLEGEGVTAVRPLGGIGEPGAVLYSDVGGVPLTQVPVRFRDAGAALRTVHRTPPGLLGVGPACSFADEVRGVARASEHIQALLPAVGDRIRAVLARALDVYPSLPNEEPGVVHGDFKVDHVRWASDRVALIDLDRCRLADPALDIGKLLADLHWWDEEGRFLHANEARSRFLAGYFGGARASRRLRAHAFEALLVAKIAARRVPVHDPRWCDRVEALVGRSERVIDALERERKRLGGRARPRQSEVAA